MQTQRTMHTFSEKSQIYHSSENCNNWFGFGQFLWSERRRY